jgi:hypothetical protein
MSWPPPARFWPGLAPDLPPNTDLKLFEAKVRTAVGVYLNDERGETEMYEEVCRQLCGVDFERLAEALENLRALPSQFRPQVVDRIDLRPLNDLLEHGKQKVNRQKYNGLKRNRDGRLYFNLLWVLRETGLPWSVSDSGPTVRVFKSIVDCLPIKPLTNRGIKDIIQKARQAEH